MNTHWQILACDLDGTLIGWDHKINDRDLEAIRRARAAGVHIAICTGRNSCECAGIIAALELEGLGVFVNGAMVCAMADGHAAHSTFVDDDVARQAIDFFGTGRNGGTGHAVLVLVDDPQSRLPAYCLTDHAPPHSATTDWLLYNRVHATQVMEIPKLYQGRIVRLGVVLNTAEAPTLHADLQRNFGTRCATHSIYSPHYDCQIIEVFHPAVNKWTGLLHLAQAMNIDSDRILAIGDDVNDVAMLRGARLSFAMGGVSPDVQTHAKRITASHAHCGVAEVIDLLLAGTLEPDSPT